MSQERPYAGIGSQHSPPEILDLMQQVARRLMLTGWMLRSGGGADSAFHKGAGMGSEIYLPEAAAGEYVAPKYVHDADWEGAERIARDLHPVWDQLDGFARYCHVRNVCIVLGRQLDDPARFVICWTRDGATTAEEWSRKTGRTGLAIALASGREIPVYNLRREHHRELARLLATC